MRTPGWVVALCAVTLTVALGGCTQPIEAGSVDGGKPVSDRTAPDTATTDPAVVSGAEPPALPAAASVNSDAGVQAFVEHYVALLNHGEATRDWQALRALTSPGCEVCAALTTPTPGRYASGGEWRTGQIVVLFDRDPDVAAAEVVVNEAPGTWLPSPGAKPTPTASQEWSFHFSLVRKQGSWNTADIVVTDH